jgi:threonine dehydrogenase-like Zn-dependent dehydrogenase
VERIGQRAAWFPERVLVTGAGPVGLLATLLATQRDYDVHVLDIVSTGPKPALVEDLGAAFHCGNVADECARADIVIECTGVPDVILEVLQHTRPSGIVCLAGMSSGGVHLTFDAGALNREMVLENDVVFGSVNANRRHYLSAVAALQAADQRWLSRLITRRVPLACWRDALEPKDDDIKVVIDLAT